jgi:hypothetical protein
MKRRFKLIYYVVCWSIGLFGVIAINSRQSGWADWQVQFFNAFFFGLFVLFLFTLWWRRKRAEPKNNDWPD